MDLYYMPSCPHCHRVLQWMEENGLEDEVITHDITASDAAADELMRIEGGEGYVPCLVDGERIVVGDGPIIEYLERRL